jgi:hypothetical protein
MLKEGMSNPGEYMKYVNKLDSLDERLEEF